MSKHRGLTVHTLQSMMVHAILTGSLLDLEESWAKAVGAARGASCNRNDETTAYWPQRAPVYLQHIGDLTALESLLSIG